VSRVLVTGLGCVSVLGADAGETWRRLLANESGVAIEDITAAAEAECSVAAPMARVREDFEGPLIRRFGRKVIGAEDRFSKLATAATLVLESKRHARARGTRFYAELAGHGASADAAHLTKPNAETAAEAVLHAHRDAGLPPDEPLLISAHGTGTLLNDITETEVFSSVYGAKLAWNLVITTMAANGHTLGAAKAMEFLIAVLALYNPMAPPVHGFLGRHPVCDLPLVLATPDIAYRAAISTTFAFCGLNCTLVTR